MEKQNILLVDDDPNVLELLKRIFRKSGYQISTAMDANEALKSLQKHPPDLILLDLMLPGMDGYSLLEKIKDVSDWSLIPVVILSAKDGVEDKLRGLRLGVVDYITKPFDRKELLARVKNILYFYDFKVKKNKPLPTKTCHQRLIDFMKEQGIKSLKPRLRREAKLGYEYPEAAEIFNPDEPGGEIYILEGMAKSKMLDRAFFDAVRICSECGNHDMNFREVCPHCDSADIDIKRTVIHHMCGYRGQDTQFDFDLNPSCPQCSETLRQEGEDFELMKSSMHTCNLCEETFIEPIINCRCMACDKLSDAATIIKRKIYIYKLKSDANEYPADQPVKSLTLGDMHSLPDNSSPKDIVSFKS